MEPREAAALPVPGPEVLARAWSLLRAGRDELDAWMSAGRWEDVVQRVDDVLLRAVLRLEPDRIADLQAASSTLRARRVSRGPGS